MTATGRTANPGNVSEVTRTSYRVLKTSLLEKLLSFSSGPFKTLKLETPSVNVKQTCPYRKCHSINDDIFEKIIFKIGCIDDLI